MGGSRQLIMADVSREFDFAAARITGSYFLPRLLYTEEKIICGFVCHVLYFSACMMQYRGENSLRKRWTVFSGQGFD